MSVDLYCQIVGRHARPPPPGRGSGLAGRPPGRREVQSAVASRSASTRRRAGWWARRSPASCGPGGRCSGRGHLGPAGRTSRRPTPRRSASAATSSSSSGAPPWPRRRRRGAGGPGRAARVGEAGQRGRSHSSACPGVVAGSRPPAWPWPRGLVVVDRRPSAPTVSNTAARPWPPWRPPDGLGRAGPRAWRPGSGPAARRSPRLLAADRAPGQGGSTSATATAARMSTPPARADARQRLAGHPRRAGRRRPARAAGSARRATG